MTPAKTTAAFPDIHLPVMEISRDYPRPLIPMIIQDLLDACPEALCLTTTALMPNGMDSLVAGCPIHILAQAANGATYRILDFSGMPGVGEKFATAVSLPPTEFISIPVATWVDSLITAHGEDYSMWTLHYFRRHVVIQAQDPNWVIGCFSLDGINQNTPLNPKDDPFAFALGTCLRQAASSSHEAMRLEEETLQVLSVMDRLNAEATDTIFRSAPQIFPYNPRAF